MDEAIAGDAAGQNLPAFRLEALQKVDVLEVDFVNLVFVISSRNPAGAKAVINALKNNALAVISAVAVF